MLTRAFKTKTKKTNITNWTSIIFLVWKISNAPAVPILVLPLLLKTVANQGTSFHFEGRGKKEKKFQVMNVPFNSGKKSQHPHSMKC